MAQGDIKVFQENATGGYDEIELVDSGKLILELGETSSTAYRGDRGKVAYDHSQTDHTPSSGGVATAIVAATAKATPVDADSFGYVDSEDSNALKKFTWANIKAALKTYFDTLYAAASSVLSLGETSVTAYRGDRGKTAYDHSQAAHAPSGAQANADITKAEIEAKLTGEISSHSHDDLTVGRTITDATSNFATTDVKKLVLANRSTAQTFTLPHTTFALNDVITVMQLGAGQVTIAVADVAKQTLNAAKKTWGADSVIQIMCIDATANAEIWKVFGGSV
jgi:hypothetical protein